MIDTRPDEVLVLQHKKQFMEGNYAIKTSVSRSQSF